IECGRPAPGSGLHAEPAAAQSADEPLRRKEIERRRRMALHALKSALAALPAKDRLIARLLGEVPIAEIARMVGLDQKALYKRKDKILRRLREALESAGVSAEDVADILGHVDT